MFGIDKYTMFLIVTSKVHQQKLKNIPLPLDTSRPKKWGKGGGWRRRKTSLPGRCASSGVRCVHIQLDVARKKARERERTEKKEETPKTRRTRCKKKENGDTQHVNSD